MNDILDHFARIIAGHPAPIVVELGANDGYHTARMASAMHACGTAWKMLVVEPDPRCFPRLQDDTEQYADHIRYVLAAVSDCNGYLPFFLSGGEERRPDKPHQRFSGSSSILPPGDVTKVWPDMTFEHSKVRVRPLDSFGAWLPRVDFIWADIQGAEVKMIAGGRAVLRRTRFLYTEYSNGGLYRGDASREQIIQALPGWRVAHDFGGDMLLENTKVEV